MNYRTLLITLLLCAVSASAAGCGAPPAKAKQAAPASVSILEGTDSKQITLLAQAAERLDIQTALVREEKLTRTWQVGATVVSSPFPQSASNDPNEAWVRANLSHDDLRRVRLGESVLVKPIDRASADPPVQALTELIVSGGDNPSGNIFAKVTAENDLAVDQRVMLEFTLPNSGDTFKLIPYSAVLYDAQGKTWVYTNPEPLVFVRQQILIDTIRGGEVILADGPPVGTAVVTVGGAELYGTEFGVGK